jgi:hypothetical protein
LQSLEGLLSFICADNEKFKADLHDAFKTPGEWRNKMEKEWNILLDTSEMSDEKKAEGRENLEYVLYKKAGSSTKAFQNGWMRDRAPDGTTLPERNGWELKQFHETEVAQKAGLAEGHVLALRLYSTSSFWFINYPLRQTKQDGCVASP